MNLVKKSEFAALCGVSPSAISRGLHNELSNALVGKHINTEHKAAIRYRKDRNLVPTPKGGRPRDIIGRDCSSIVLNTLAKAKHYKNVFADNEKGLEATKKLENAAYALGMFRHTAKERKKIVDYIADLTEYIDSL